MKIKIDTGRENFGNPRKMKLRKLRTKRASSARSVCKAKGAGECTMEKKKRKRQRESGRERERRRRFDEERESRREGRNGDGIADWNIYIERERDRKKNTWYA